MLLVYELYPRTGDDFVLSILSFRPTCHETRKRKKHGGEAGNSVARLRKRGAQSGYALTRNPVRSELDIPYLLSGKLRPSC